MVMAMPGNMTSHQGGLNKLLSSPPSMLPHVGVGGGIPNPRKAERRFREYGYPKPGACGLPSPPPSTAGLYAASLSALATRRYRARRLHISHLAHRESHRTGNPR